MKNSALLLLAILFLTAFGRPAFGQGPLQQLAYLPIPNWTTGNTSIDLMTFNPATKVMYLADRVNHGATAIDTATLTVLGTIVPPNCAKLSNSCPSGVQIAPDLQKLVLTSRATAIFVYDLRVPGQAPDVITGPDRVDELDYDPINHRVYIGNTVAPYFITVVDLTTDTLVGQIPFPTSVEQPRFNPVDGLIYVTTPDDDSPTHAGQAVVVIDPNQGTAGAIVRTIPVSSCAPHAIDIDPVTNTALLGCSATAATAGLQLMDLSSGTILATFPSNGNDLGQYNRKLRRWYFGGGHNSVQAPANCPGDSTGAFVQVAVISDASGTAQFVGAQCAGRNSNQVGVDPIMNNVYVASRQFPVNPSSANTGQPGVFVFHDSAPLALPFAPGSELAAAHVAVSAAGSGGASGTIFFSLRRRNMSVDGNLSGLPSSFAPTSIMITTTVGNEVVTCGVNGQGGGSCEGYLIGDPLIGGVMDVSSGGQIVGSGKIVQDTLFPVFIPIE